MRTGTLYTLGMYGHKIWKNLATACADAKAIKLVNVYLHFLLSVDTIPFTFYMYMQGFI